MIHKKIKYLAILAVIPLFTYGFEEDFFNYVFAERTIEGDFVCHRGRVLVHRFSHGNFMCVTPSTADRWEEIGLAEKITNVNVSTLCSKTTGTDAKPSALQNEHPMMNMVNGDVKCIRADRVATLLVKDWTLLGVTAQFQLGIQPQATECEAGLVPMQETKTGVRACVNQNQVNFLLLADWHSIGTRTEQIIQLACNEGATPMKNQETGEEKCFALERKSTLQQEWVEITDEGVVRHLICKGNSTLMYNPQNGKEICATPTQIDQLFSVGWRMVEAEEKPIIPQPTRPVTQTASGTIFSNQDPGIGHETHQLAIILSPSDDIYDGDLSFTASEPVQIVMLVGPLGPGQDKGQPQWTSDGEQKYGLVLLDNDDKSGRIHFTGNAVALHTMSLEPFSVNYDMVYQQLPTSNTVKIETLDSVKDPVGYDEKQHLVIILPRGENIYHGNVVYTASEPVQLVSLHGPLTPDQAKGHQTWSPDGITIYGVTFGDHKQKMGDWEFTSKAVGLQTLNDTPFTVTFAVSANSLPSGK